MRRDYYRILQVDPEADPEIIRAAYQRLVKKFHPDRNPSADATKRLQEINEAYSVVGDATRRAAYDSGRRAPDSQSGPQAEPSASGSDRPRSTRTSDAHTESRDNEPEDDGEDEDSYHTSTARESDEAAARQRRAERTREHDDRIGSRRTRAVVGAVALLLMLVGAPRLLIREAPPHATLSPTPTVRNRNTAPPLPFDDVGACPYEGCRFEEWYGQKHVAVHRERSATSPIVYYISPHERVTALDGVIHTTVAGLAEVEGRPLEVGGAVAGVGTRVHILSYASEGCILVWFPNDVWSLPPKGAYQCAGLRDISYPTSEWWVRVKNHSGQIGWVFDGGGLAPNDALLVATIADESSTLSDKLRRIDAMLKNGANLNGPPAQYTDSPAEAAVLTKQVDLVSALIARGMRLDGDAQGCVAYKAFYLNNPADTEGLAFLSYLLDSGMSIDCLTESPFESLIFGCSLPTYRVANAIVAARVFVRHGISPKKPSRSGATAIDRLSAVADDTCRRNLAPLINELRGYD